MKFIKNDEALFFSLESERFDDAKKFLKENNIKFEDIDVSENQDKAQEMIKRSGQMGVPVLDIDGAIIVGFDKEKIKETLGL